MLTFSRNYQIKKPRTDGYTNWAPGQPDHWSDSPGYSESCVEMWQDQDTGLTDFGSHGHFLLYLSHFGNPVELGGQVERRQLSHRQGVRVRNGSRWQIVAV